MLRGFDRRAGGAMDVPDPYYGDERDLRDVPRHDRVGVRRARRPPGGLAAIDPLTPGVCRDAYPR